MISQRVLAYLQTHGMLLDVEYEEEGISATVTIRGSRETLFNLSLNLIETDRATLNHLGVSLNEAIRSL